MTPLQRTLYDHLQEQRLFVWDAEYENFCRCADRNEARLRDTLSPEQTGLLEAMLQNLDLRTGVELEALFQSALSMGLELGRL